MFIFPEISKQNVGSCEAIDFIYNPGFPLALTEEVKVIHGRHFSGDQYVFLQMDALENEEVFYGKSEFGLAPLNGYYIYYEKNEAMQAYMSGQKKGMGIEPDGRCC